MCGKLIGWFVWTFVKIALVASIVEASRETVDRYGFPGGGSRIRTYEGFPPSGFQDRRNRPLCHPSAASIAFPFPRSQGRGSCPLGRRYAAQTYRDSNDSQRQAQEERREDPKQRCRAAQ